MDNPAAGQAASPKAQFQWRSRCWAGYTGFVAVLLVAMLTNNEAYAHARLVISLLAVSLPSLIAQMLLDFVVSVRQGRRKSAKRGLAATLGLFPSLGAVTMLVGHFSWIAAVIFVLLIFYWFLVIDRVIYLASNDPKSDI